ncbi:Diacylglycerol kinase 7-like protein, partial [Drosera capensis]
MVTVDTAATAGNDSPSKPSAISSLRGFGFTGNRIDKHDLRRRISLPQHLRLAMRRAMETRDAFAADGVDSKEWEGVEAAEAPMVVFLNSRSGGRHGGELKRRLEELMEEDQVFDLKDVKPNDFVQYGLGSLEHLVSRGDYCAKDAREKIRVVVAGGDGTVGWVLGSLGELYKQGREPVPPVAVIPLGTGNDLSRSFGWGGSFPFSWKAAVKKSLDRATRGLISSLDSWHVSVTMPAGGSVELPYALKPTEERTHDQVSY